MAKPCRKTQRRSSPTKMAQNVRTVVLSCERTIVRTQTNTVSSLRGAHIAAMAMRAYTIPDAPAAPPVAPSMTSCVRQPCAATSAA